MLTRLLADMEVLHHFGSKAQKAEWLQPLMDVCKNSNLLSFCSKNCLFFSFSCRFQGRIRSGFAMTEPAVASSDATNIALDMYETLSSSFGCRLIRLCMQITSSHVVLNGVKWWTTNALHPRCKILIVMGKTNPSHPSPHKQQSMVLVPMDAPGVTVLRSLSFCGHAGTPPPPPLLFLQLNAPIVQRKARAGTPKYGSSVRRVHAHCRV
jgi:acyl-CoA dehydrogenase